MTPAPAFAGAWVAPEGGQQITSSIVGERNELRFYETSVYWETPVGSEGSIVAAPWVERNYDTFDGWRAEAVVGYKRALLRDGGTVIAVQGGALWASHPDEGCSEGGAELRGLMGHAFANGAFFNAEAAARELEGGCGGQRFELTLGYHPRENWLAMGQVFTDDTRDHEETVKAQLTLVRFGRSGRAIQLGVRARVDDGLQEPALVLSLWGRPGD